MRLHHILMIFPFLILFALISLLAWELFHFKPDLPSTLIGEDVPTFSLQNVYPSQPPLTNTMLSGRGVVLLNVWATWCDACSMEHAMLMKISQEYHVPIYSIDYKDDTQNAIHWLEENGNPYVLTGEDSNGDVAINLGVYGTPETFVINSLGKIVYRHIGMIDQKVWDETLYPLIKKYSEF